MFLMWLHTLCCNTPFSLLPLSSVLVFFPSGLSSTYQLYLPSRIFPPSGTGIDFSGALQSGHISRRKILLSCTLGITSTKSRFVKLQVFLAIPYPLPIFHYIRNVPFTENKEFLGNFAVSPSTKMRPHFLCVFRNDTFKGKRIINRAAHSKKV